MGTGEWLGIAGIVVGIVGALVAYWIYKKEREVRILDYQIRSNTELVAFRAAGRFASAFKVHYGDDPLPNPRLVELRIRNVGNRAIEAADYRQAIHIKYEMNTPIESVISAASNEMLASDIEVNYTADHTVKLTPPLLNSQDWFDVQVLSNGDPGTITVSSWFTDQTRPMQNVGDRKTSSVTRYLRLLLLVAAGSLIAVVLNAKDSLNVVVPIIVAVTILSMGFDLISEGRRSRGSTL